MHLGNSPPIALGDQRIRQTYAKNLIDDAVISGGESESLIVAELTDGDLTTYWQPAEPASEFVIKLDQPQRINRFVLQEAISLVGQRIKAHELDAWMAGNWQTIATGTTVGYKEILRFPDVTTDRFRVRILESRALPTVAEIAAHCYVVPAVERP
jgi:alpha-L-fucosidase